MTAGVMPQLYLSNSYSKTNLNPQFSTVVLVVKLVRLPHFFLTSKPWLNELELKTSEIEELFFFQT